jgi:hypothetical protein
MHHCQLYCQADPKGSRIINLPSPPALPPIWKSTLVMRQVRPTDLPGESILPGFVAQTLEALLVDANTVLTMTLRLYQLSGQVLLTLSPSLS